MQTYSYTATNERGQQVSGTVRAASQADARIQIERLNLDDIELVATQAADDAVAPGYAFDLDPLTEAVRALNESTAATTIRAIIGHWLIWLPPLLLLLWRVSVGSLSRGVDAIIIVYALAAGVLLLGMVGAGVSQHRLLLARANGRAPAARGWLTVLGQLRLFAGVTSKQIAQTRAVAMAMQGPVETAVRRLAAEKDRIGDAACREGLVFAHDAAGGWSDMIAAQRDVLAHAQRTDGAKTDLALSLARYGAADEHAKEAAELLATVVRTGLSPVMQIGFDIAAGVVAVRDGQFDVGVAHYQRAVAAARPHLANPEMCALVVEVGALAAIALKKAGRADAAQSIWRAVESALAARPSGRALVPQYEAA